MSTPTPPAGWYPDPDGTGGQRWWDGNSWSSAPPPIAEPADEPKHLKTELKKAGLGLGALAAVIAVLVLGATFLGGGDSDGDEESGGAGDGTTPASVGDAQVRCREFIKDQLKAPATADFSDEQTDGSGTDWSSSGSVDAENSFGAKVRGTYSCEMTYDPETLEWTLVDSTLEQ